MARRQAAPKVALEPRDQSIADLHQVRAEIRDHLIRAGIQEAEFTVPVRGLEEKTTDEINTLLSWHLEFKKGPWNAVQLIWKLREPAFWDNLLLFGQHRLREQKLLRAELKKLRIAWRARHGEPADEANSGDIGAPEPSTPRK